jgi:hypothetical protein
VQMGLAKDLENDNKEPLIAVTETNRQQQD